jgi:DNA-binding GntR family transcriptional regulator
MHARRGGFAGESLNEHEMILKALDSGRLDRAAKAVEYHRLAAMERLERTS